MIADQHTPHCPCVRWQPWWWCRKSSQSHRPRAATLLLCAIQAQRPGACLTHVMLIDCMLWMKCDAWCLCLVIYQRRKHSNCRPAMLLSARHEALSMPPSHTKHPNLVPFHAPTISSGPPATAGGFMTSRPSEDTSCCARPRRICAAMVSADRAVLFCTTESPNSSTIFLYLLDARVVAGQQQVSAEKQVCD